MTNQSENGIITGPLAAVLSTLSDLFLGDSFLHPFVIFLFVIPGLFGGLLAQIGP